MSDDPNYIEMEVLVPTRIQYSTVRLRAGRLVPYAPHDADGKIMTSGDWRARAWDFLADELASQAARQAERVATRVLHEQQKTGDGIAGKRY